MMSINPGFPEFLQTTASKYNLSKAEQEALMLAVESYDITAIAQQLQVQPSAVRQRLSQVYQKFQIEGKGPVKLAKLQQLLLSQFQQYQAENANDTFGNRNHIQPECIYLEEAPAATVFFGRTKELTILKQWVVGDKCRLIALLGMAGIGKSCLAVKLVQQIQDKFDYIIWRSLRYAPTLPEFLTDIFQMLFPNQKTDLPDHTGRQISQLMKYLQSFRCLLIIDDVETIMESKKLAGYYDKGYEVYRDLFQRIGESSHHSCLLLISREKPIEIASMEGLILPVRSLQIGGLLAADANKIITSAKELTSSEDDLTELIQLYGGNPAALKIVTTTIQELFNGDLVQYLKSNELFIGDILGEMLEAQFKRLSDLETKVMYWLALNDKPLSLNEMKSQVLFHGESPEILGIIESLLRRSLVEKNTQSDEIKFTLLPIFIKYVINYLMQIICRTITAQDYQNLNIDNFDSVKYQLLKAVESLGKLDNFDFSQNPALYKKIARLLNIIGYDLYMNKEFTRAKFYLLLAINFQPDRAAPHYNLASIYEEIGEIELAKHHYQKAAEKENNPGYAATNNLARLEIIEKNYSVAMERIFRILERVQDNNIKAILAKNLGAAYFEQNQYNEAQKYLRLSIDLNGSNKSAHDLLEEIIQAKIAKRKISFYTSYNMYEKVGCLSA